ncbi:N/A [soil metagenome]
MMGKINLNKLSGLDPIRTDTQREIKNSGKDAGLTIKKGTAAVGDKLEISSRAAEVGNLVDQLRALPDIRQDKVNALKEQIAAGTYNPSSETIANAILADNRS